MKQSNIDEQERTEVFRAVNDFLKDSAKNRTWVTEQKRALIAYSGGFWDKDAIDKCRREERANFEVSPWRTMVNAVTSRVSASPWHCEIKDDQLPKEWDIQGLVNDFESRLGSKAAQNEAFKRGVACGAGYVHIISDGDNPRLESVKQHNSVFIDPWARSPSLEDANEAAICNFISKKQAERDYGFTGNRVECQNAEIYTHQESATFVSYYKKDEDGHVIRYDICGDYVERIDLPCHIIPLIRFAGYETVREEGVHYEGIVQLTYDIQASSNIAFSSLVERMNSGSNQTIIATPIQAMGGAAVSADGSKNVNGIMIQNGMKECMQGKSAIFPYDGNAGTPAFHENHFNTDDLTNVITMNRQLMEDATGISLTGNENLDKTATEILVQDNSKDASVTELYMNAEMASRSIAKVILQLLCGGQTPNFELENGPAVILTQQKMRQKFALVAEMASPEMHPYLSAKLADILDLPEDICATLAANVGDIQVVNGNMVTDNGDTISLSEQLNIGRVAQTQLAQLKVEAEEAINSQQEMQNEIQQLQNSLADQKSQYELQLAELKMKMVKMQADMELTDAKAELTKAQATEKTIDNTEKLAFQV